jgi:hypothetical protein
VCTTSAECASELCARSYGDCATGHCANPGALGAKCLYETHACASGLTCALNTCVSNTAIAAGDACTLSSQCAKGLYCGSTGTGMACKVPGKLGAACSALDGCAEGFYCDFAASSCKAKGDVGAACTVLPYDQGEWTNTCTAGAACSGSPNLCRKTVGLGGPCADDVDCAGKDLLCLPASGSNRTCAGLPHNGQACTAAKGTLKATRCLPPFTCVGGVCVDAPGIDESCSDQCAKGLVCDTGSKLCGPAPGLGQACTTTCAAGYLCDHAGGKGKCIVQKGCQ